MNRRFVAYYRVSTVKQGVSGLGLDAQRDAITQFVKGGGWEMIGEFTDVESGTSKGNGRPELAKALAQAKRMSAVLVIAKLDRLARNVAFVSRLMESGVEFVAADNPSANKLTIHILAAVAEAEAEAISKRTKDALEAARSRGVRLGNPGNLTQEARRRGAAAQRKMALEDYALICGRVATLRRSGLSFREIASTLNSEGWLTREGRPFAAMTVKRIFDRTVERPVR